MAGEYNQVYDERPYLWLLYRRRHAGPGAGLKQRARGLGGIRLNGHSVAGLLGGGKSRTFDGTEGGGRWWRYSAGERARVSHEVSEVRCEVSEEIIREE